jgi:alpha-L-fucosidase
MNRRLLRCLSLLILAGCRSAAPPAPVPPVPSPQQVAWHGLAYYAFVHFNMNTFTGVEWGDGQETPERFNPAAFDARQWVQTFKDAGMTGVILTAKHHDGFCLWPSRYTNHDVARSPWCNGQGDVLRELSDACRAAGLKFGVYLSPWDRNHPDYGSEAYNTVFKNQLSEVLSAYGPIFEVWFDGANGEGPNGKRQVYDWPGFIATVRQHQPDAVIFSDAGPEVRWVGNERGEAGLTSWSMLQRDRFYPGTPDYRELTEGHEDGTHWVPPECDVSIRPGWYWRAAEDTLVKTLPQLVDLYYQSVGRNCNLLLNVPPNDQGLIPATDARRLRELRQVLDATFAVNLAAGARVTASSQRGRAFRASHTTDADPTTYWAAPDGITSATLTLDLPQPATFNVVLLQEHIALGQRVRAFAVEAWVDGRWQPVGEGTTIGHKRLLRGAPVTTSRLRLTLRDARACPTISNIGLYREPQEMIP